MGLIDSLKEKVGGDKSSSRSDRGMRSGKKIQQPPGNDQPRQSRDRGGTGRQPPQQNQQPRQENASLDPSQRGPPGQNDRENATPGDALESPSGENPPRGGPGRNPPSDQPRQENASLDNPGPGPDTDIDQQFGSDFGPQQGGGPGRSQEQGPASNTRGQQQQQSPPARNERQGQNRSPQPSRQGGGGGPDDLPEPRDYNLDLPQGGGSEPAGNVREELHQITEQNERIIDLLRQIKNGMRS